MVKIKTKKEMTLSELVGYGFNNPKKIRGKIFKPQSFDSFWNPANVKFSDDGCAVNVNGSVTDEDVYTVEIDEELTEDTVLDAVVIVRRQISIYGGESTHVCRKGNVSINQVLSHQPNNSRFVYLEIHLMKNDRIDKLIWTKEKGLVE